jgi:hypothetical protein
MVLMMNNEMQIHLYRDEDRFCDGLNWQLGLELVL